MGYAEYDIRLPAGEPDSALRPAIARMAGFKDFTFTILNKSLDARRKGRIEWQFRIGVSSERLKSGKAPVPPTLAHEAVGKSRSVVVVGTGPAGIFAASFLVRSGFKVTVLERGSQVEARRSAIQAFEAGGDFPASNNYSFGEGGAGTFSDGKLSSRTKSISAERNYIFADFISAGAPHEIAWMTHPHLGSDKLFTMTLNLRRSLIERGVQFRFDSPASDIDIQGDRVTAIRTPGDQVQADFAVFACGHSALETYRMLMDRDVAFRPKNFAIGFRAEHEQELINRAQWGIAAIKGVKAAEYRLTAPVPDCSGVYSFCMCPGGTVVPAAAYAGTNIVNGMSNYARDGRYANAAVVAGLNLEHFLGRGLSAREALDWLDQLERRYHAAAPDYRAPAMTIADFLAGTSGGKLGPSSHPIGLASADFGELLPAGLVEALRAGLRDFCRKLNGYDGGQIMGLESKTSAPIQAVRHPELLYSRYGNLFVAGEGSGWSGGIVSSAADGLKVAQAICRVAAG